MASPVISSSGVIANHSAPTYNDSTNNRIKKLEEIKEGFNFVKTVGVVCLVAGPILAGLFFGAPIIPTAFFFGITMMILCIPIVLIGLSPPPATPYGGGHASPQEMSEGLKAFGNVFGWIIKTTYTPIANFTYAPRVALIAGSTFGAIGGVGILAFGIGALGEAYCDKKIAELTQVNLNT